MTRPGKRLQPARGRTPAPPTSRTDRAGGGRPPAARALSPPEAGGPQPRRLRAARLVTSSARTAGRPQRQRRAGRGWAAPAAGGAGTAHVAQTQRLGGLARPDPAAASGYARRAVVAASHGLLGWWWRPRTAGQWPVASPAPAPGPRDDWRRSANDSEAAVRVGPRRPRRAARPPVRFPPTAGPPGNLWARGIEAAAAPSGARPWPAAPLPVLLRRGEPGGRTDPYARGPGAARVRRPPGTMAHAPSGHPAEGQALRGGTAPTQRTSRSAMAAGQGQGGKGRGGMHGARNAEKCPGVGRGLNIWAWLQWAAWLEPEPHGHLSAVSTASTTVHRRRPDQPASHGLITRAAPTPRRRTPDTERGPVCRRVARERSLSGRPSGRRPAKPRSCQLYFKPPTAEERQNLVMPSPCALPTVLGGRCRPSHDVHLTEAGGLAGRQAARDSDRGASAPLPEAGSRSWEGGSGPGRGSRGSAMPLAACFA
jgi:hypothetical protein